ncbi:MAG TPA: Na(+)/H(+) antiporter subunit B [Bacteroidales bacterium]|nr:Na(+)/H(+) antiporter subunit B [Bacteroidales bacterium]HRX10381.1 Na(+)/H(+) antiporter subunit B [Draconibacterium sp.]
MRNSIAIALVLIFGIFLFRIFEYHHTSTSLNNSATYYNTNAPAEVGTANVVTAIVVTYRGLDTLGEVTVLFLTALIIGYILKQKNREKSVVNYTSEILITAVNILIPASIILGVYVFINGHLTPGGGFQGGAIIATGIVLLILSNPSKLMNMKVLHFIESISGFTYILIGLAGLLFAGGFLDNRILPLGNIGNLLSAGAIPIIYSLIGLKVGTEISSILASINETKENTIKP